MKRHFLWGRLGPSDLQPSAAGDTYRQVTAIDLIAGKKTLNYGVGQAINGLNKVGLEPSEVGVDLAILAALVTAADTRIERTVDGQDSWTREIDISLPVSDVPLWQSVNVLLCDMLKFLTGDIWRFSFRKRPAGFDKLSPSVGQLPLHNFSAVSLFSGGLDSYIGAIDLFEEKKKQPLFVSHYWDQSTSNQDECAAILAAKYGDFKTRHMRSRVGFGNSIVAGSIREGTLRGRSFLFFALAGLAASSSDNIDEILVPENGLISLNVPLDPLRLGAWSTRTTHPYYLARWNNLLPTLGICGDLNNPYRYSTKGEMAEKCQNKPFLNDTYKKTLSCSSVSKARWSGTPFGHCGHCVPCLIRRASVTHAFGVDNSGYWAVPNLTATTILNTRKAEGRDVRSFQLMQNKLSKGADIHSVLVHKSGPLNDYTDVEIEQYAAVFKRGIEEVGTLLKNVTAKPLW